MQNKRHIFSRYLLYRLGWLHTAPLHLEQSATNLWVSCAFRQTSMMLHGFGVLSERAPKPQGITEAHRKAEPTHMKTVGYLHLSQSAAEHCEAALKTLFLCAYWWVHPHRRLHLCTWEAKMVLAAACTPPIQINDRCTAAQIFMQIPGCTTMGGCSLSVYRSCMNLQTGICVEICPLVINKLIARSCTDHLFLKLSETPNESYRPDYILIFFCGESIQPYCSTLKEIHSVFVSFLYLLWLGLIYFLS